MTAQRVSFQYSQQLFLDNTSVIEREKHYVAFSYLHDDNHSRLLLNKTLQDIKRTYDKGIRKGRKNNHVTTSTTKLRLVFEQHDDYLHPLSKYQPLWQEFLHIY